MLHMFANRLRVGMNSYAGCQMFSNSNGFQFQEIIGVIFFKCYQQLEEQQSNGLKTTRNKLVLAVSS